MNEDNKGASVKFPPPLVFVGAIAAGIYLNAVYPLKVSSVDIITLALPLLAAVLIVLATLLILSAIIALRRAKTSIEPWKPTTHIISSGVFGLSRNPIYLAFVGFDVASSLLLNNMWILITLVPAIWLIITLVIKKEEHYLKKKFSVEYTQYCTKVRRWL